MLKHLLYITILSFGVIFTSCETEVDVFAEQDGATPVIFALLEPAADTQIFRINPTFVGEGDARNLAGDPNLTNYKANQLEVKLFDRTSDLEFTFLESTSIVKLNDNGIFDTMVRSYYLPTEVDRIFDSLSGKWDIVNTVLQPLHDYELYIKDNESGKTARSIITLGDIGALSMTYPLKGLSQFPKDWMNFHTGSIYNDNYTFEFRSGIISERFLLQLKYYYTYVGEDNDLKDHSIIFDIGEINDLSNSGSQKNGLIKFDGERFYTIIDSKLSGNSALTGQTADLILTAAGPDLDTYVTIQNATLSGITQEKPVYSNIDGGIGVFSYRLVKPQTEYKITESSAIELRNGPITGDIFDCSRFGTQNDSRGVIRCN